MAVTPPPVLTLPGLSPDRQDRTTFAARSIARDDYIKNVQVPQLILAMANVAANAADAANSAANATQTQISNIYRGALAADPATRTDGSANQAGDEYFSTTANLLKRFNGTTWQASDINTANLAASTGAGFVGFTQGPQATPTTVSAAVKSLLQKGTTLTAFGDSFTFGVDASGAYTTENYVNFIGRATGLTVVNKGISGSLIIDLGSNFYNTTTSSNDVFTTMTGFNDGRVYGTSANGLLTYKGVLRAMLTWLALPDGAKFLANSAGVSYTGTWATLTGIYANKNTSKFTLTPGSTATAVIKGNSIYIGHTRSVSTPAIFRVTIDGSDYGTFTNAAWTASNSGMSYGPDLLRISGLPSTKKHAVIITHVSGGEFYLDYMSGNGGANAAYPGPSVFSANTVRMLDYSHELSSDAGVDKYNFTHRQVVSELVSDGLNIMHVDTSSGYDPIAHGSANPLQVHPTLVGEQYLSATFLQAMTQTVAAVDKNRMLEKYKSTFGLYIANPTADTAVPAGTFTFIDFDNYTTQPGWVFLPSSERSYYPQTPGYYELSVTVTFKLPIAAGRYYFELFDVDTGTTITLYDEERAATSGTGRTVFAAATVYANGLGTRFRVRVYSSVATTIASGNGLTRFQAKFIGA